MILSRPVAARATRIASMVASVPEFTNRTWSTWNRSQMSSASATVASVVTAKWIAPSAASLMASTILGCAWPTTLTPKPPWKSRVLVAVHVPDRGALALLEVHRVGIAGLEVRGHPAGQALHCSLVQRLGPLGPVEHYLGFPLGDLRRARLQSIEVHAYHPLRCGKGTRRSPGGNASRWARYGR